MFGFLKKKISNFTNKIKDKLQQKAKDSLDAKKIEKVQEPISEKVSEPQIGTSIDIQKVKEEGISEDIQKLKDDKRELKAEKRLRKKLTGFLLGSITIEEKDVEDFLDEFELALLESDVEQDTAEQIIEELKKELVGKKLKRGENLTEFLKNEIKIALNNVMQTETIDLMEKLKEKKPYIVLMLGPNGAGKTTSIAKITHLLQGQGKKVILASSDTFRAGSIEQIEIHAKRLETRLVKHKYGADPAAVAFDAVKAAKATNADIVLIDSAGRQETNKNLMEELKKIIRVINPDLKIFVGEAYSGQNFLFQAEKFNEELGIDGFILTKIDTDTKGGTAISLLYKIKKPIMFVGTGQKYSDLEKFNPEFILNRII